MTRLFISAINQYDQKVYGGNINLNGCVKDGEAIAATLQNPFEGIFIKDQECTKERIVEYLEYFAGQCQPGDTWIWFHSGHGTYYDRFSGGKRRVTMRVLHDNYLPDDEVAIRMAAFKKGVTVIIINDCCYAKGNSKNTPKGNVRARTIEYRGPSKVLAMDYNIKYEATINYLSASELDEPSYEDENGGFFTQALVREIKRPGKNYLSTLVKRINEKLRIQTANLEVVNGSRVKKATL